MQVQKKQITTTARQTQKLGENFARKILAGKNKGPVVIGLQGDLGSGKTTFLQGFAKGLGIKEKVLSPTFVIMKRFVIPAKAGIQFQNFYHIDCYRLKNHKDILELGWEKIINPPAGGPKNIIAVEWPQKIKKALPKNLVLIKFKFLDKNKRELTFPK